MAGQTDSGIVLNRVADHPCAKNLYVENVDDVYKKALASGATSLREPADQFYGDRNAQVRDPSGHCWDIATRIEEVSPEEMQKRFNAMINRSSRFYEQSEIRSSLY